MKDEEEAHAMTLCTRSPNQEPTGRIVLLKEVDRKEASFLFYTRHNSPKGEDIRHHNQVGLVFFWRRTARQVRIQGTAHPVPKEKAAAYFATRPRGSQLAAQIAPQSTPIPSWERLREEKERLAVRYAGQKIPVPPDWGGYSVRAHSIEFWTGKPDRLHERVLYRKEGDGGRWKGARLAP